MNAIAPGSIRSIMTEAMPQRVGDAKVAEVTVRCAGGFAKWPTPLCFFIFDLSLYMTGTVMEVTGGLSI